MRWVKHLSNAHSDPEIDGILEEFGAAGYGVFWLLVEEIAGAMEPKSMCTSLIHSDVKWASIVHTSVRKWRSIAKKMSDRSLISIRSTDNRIQIDIPNILKYRDEYSKKSGHSPDSRADTDTDQRQSIDTRQSPDGVPAPSRESAPSEPEQEQPFLLPPLETPGFSTLDGSAKPKKAKRQQDALDLLVQPYAERIHTRHPEKRRGGIGEVKAGLRKIAMLVPSAMRPEMLKRIDANHQGWCETEQWQKEDGEFAKGLANWLAPTKRLWDCPAPKTRSPSLLPANPHEIHYPDLPDYSTWGREVDDERTH